MRLASEFNLEVELKNIILVAFRFFEFLHSQGQKRKWPRLNGMSVLPSRADIVRPTRHFRFVPVNETARAVGAAAWGAGVPAMDGRWERVA
jgi:hypothetical protein